MWYILNKLFGWDYVKVTAYVNEIKIKRCYFDGGVPYIAAWDGRAAFLNRDGTTFEYEESQKWEPLTFDIDSLTYRLAER